MTHNGKHRPFSVKLYMPDGNPDGLKLIEKSNWTGVGLVIPRPLYELTQDYGFSSPSTAAGVVLGRSANGRAEWKTGDGRMLREVQG